MACSRVTFTFFTFTAFFVANVTDVSVTIVSEVPDTVLSFSFTLLFKPNGVHRILTGVLISP